jgi:hypothetical protein
MKHMPHTMQRLRKLAGLNESDLVSDEEQLVTYEEQERRQQLVAEHITNVFKRLGIVIAPQGVTYEEYPTNDVTVVLDDHPMGYDIARLNKLQSSGLADSYRVVPLDSDFLKIEFTLKPEVYKSLGIE